MRFTLLMQAIVESVESISKSKLFRLKSGLILSFGLALFLAVPLSVKVAAQETKVTAPETSTVAPVSRVGDPTPATDDNRYRIGPGDVLNILVRKAPELSGAVRVDQRGMIRIPMIDGEIQAACRTESELALEIATLYLEYKQKPNVEVFVTDFQSRPVAITGAVNSPGQFRLQRRVRLLELINFAGGPANSAGRVINIIHTGEPNVCAPKPAESKPDDSLARIAMYKLFDTLKAKDEANPFVQPGDIIRIPEADLVYILGHVNSPGPIALKDKTITISRAMAMAGGPARDGKTSRIRIIRQIGDGSEKQEILVDLKAIQKRQAVDVILLPNDIVEVGASATKTILAMLTGAVPATLSQGVVRAIP